MVDRPQKRRAIPSASMPLPTTPQNWSRTVAENAIERLISQKRGAQSVSTREIHVGEHR